MKIASGGVFLANSPKMLFVESFLCSPLLYYDPAGQDKSIQE